MNSGNEFGNLLRTYRKNAKLTQHGLAIKIGKSASLVSRWETGSDAPGRKFILKLAGEMGLGTTEKNKLLQAAGYLPEEEGGLDFGNKAVREIATFLARIETSYLDGKHVSDPSKAEYYENAIIKLVEIWSEFQESSSRHKTQLSRILDNLDQFADQISVPLWITLGEISEQEGDLRSAHNWYERVQTTAQILSDKTLEGEMMIRMGDTLQDRYDKNAFRVFKDAIIVLEETGDPLKALRGRRKLASAYLALGEKTEEARNKLEQLSDELHKLSTIKRSKNYVDKINKELSKTLNYLGWAYSISGKEEQGIKAREESLNIAKNLDDAYLITLALHLLGDNYRSLNKVNEAKERYNNSLDESAKINTQTVREREQGIIYRGLGATYARERNWRKARESLTKSIRIFIELDNSYGLAKTLDERGRFYLLTRKYARAKQDFEQALKLFIGVENSYYIVITLIYLSEACCYQWAYDEREEALLEAQDYAEKAERKVSENGNQRLFTRVKEMCALLALCMRKPSRETKMKVADAFIAAQQNNIYAEYKDWVKEHISVLETNLRYDPVIGLTTYLQELIQEEKEPDEPFLNYLIEQKEIAQNSKERINWKLDDLDIE